jgi:hypothetical protein
MRILWMVIFLFILFGGHHFDGLYAQEAAGPKMVIEERSFDYKEISEGDILKHTFIIMNRGDQPLEIKRVKPG